MAEGFARRAAPADAVVWSAGTEPRGVHPLAIEVMNEVGVDLSTQSSKSLDDVPWREADTVVTLCGDAGEICPTLAADVRYRHWPLPDPSLAPESERRETFRSVRDEIRWRVSSLWPGSN